MILKQLHGRVFKLKGRKDKPALESVNSSSSNDKILSTDCAFLKIPPEIRLKIYNIILTTRFFHVTFPSEKNNYSTGQFYPQPLLAGRVGDQRYAVEKRANGPGWESIFTKFGMGLMLTCRQM